VRTEIEVGDAGCGQHPDRVAKVVHPASQGKDRSMMIGIAVEIEEKGSECGGPFCQEGLIAAFADIDHALGDHLRRRYVVKEPKAPTG
jgi:hypothetical protein